MKRKLTLLIVSVVSLFCLAVPQLAGAVDVLPQCQDPAAKNTTVCQDHKNSGANPLFGPNGLFTIVIKWLSIIVGVLAVIVIVFAGVSLVVSGGDSNSATTARRMITYALIGIVLALFAQAIVSFVLNKL